MGTATHDPGTHHPPAPHDPERDIGARSATWWVVGGTIVLFVSLWLMLPIFLRVLEVERVRKIDEIVPAERLELLAKERQFLNGGNPKKKTIDQVMQEM